MNIYRFNNHVSKDENGAIAIITALILLFVLLGVGALAVDLGRMATVKNEIQNAVDAGALAGASVLFVGDKTSYSYNTITNVSDEAFKFTITNAKNNFTTNPNVEWGHWSFIKNKFIAYNSSIHDLIQPTDVFSYIMNLRDNDSDLEDFKNAEVLDRLDGSDYNGDNPFFINAVQVTAVSDETQGFFSSIFNNNGFSIKADAVGYIGPAGGWEPFELDYPIAICEGSLRSPDICNIGRMLEDDTEGETAKWTDFSECHSVSASSIEPLLDTCGEANPRFISQGENIGVTNGVTDSVYDHPNKSNLSGCWRSESENLLACDGASEQNPTQPLSMVLPVVDCSEGPNCNPVVGAVNVDLLWITDKEDVEAETPCTMGKPDMMDLSDDIWDKDIWADDNDAWNFNDHCSSLKNITDQGGTIQEAIDFLNDDVSGYGWNVDATRWGQGHQPYTTGMARWDCFTHAFNIEAPSGKPAPFAKKTIYFAVNCETIDAGQPGDEVDFYGVLSNKPVLVE